MDLSQLLAIGGGVAKVHQDVFADNGIIGHKLKGTLQGCDPLGHPPLVVEGQAEVGPCQVVVGLLGDDEATRFLRGARIAQFQVSRRQVVQDIQGIRAAFQGKTQVIPGGFITITVHEHRSIVVVGKVIGSTGSDQLRVGLGGFAPASALGQGLRSSGPRIE